MNWIYLQDTPLCHVTYNTTLMHSLKAKLTQITRAALELSPFPCTFSSHHPHTQPANSTKNWQTMGWNFNNNNNSNNNNNDNSEWRNGLLVSLFLWSASFKVVCVRFELYLGQPFFPLPPEPWHGRESTGSWAACGFSQHKKNSMCLYLEVEKGTIASRKKKK